LFLTIFLEFLFVLLTLLFGGGPSASVSIFIYFVQTSYFIQESPSWFERTVFLRDVLSECIYPRSEINRLRQHLIQPFTVFVYLALFFAVPKFCVVIHRLSVALMGLIQKLWLKLNRTFKRLNKRVRRKNRPAIDIQTESKGEENERETEKLIPEFHPENPHPDRETRSSKVKRILREFRR